MIRNIVWKGLDSDTLEFCSISFGECILVKSTIVGCSDGIPLKAEYEIQLSKNWLISSATIKTRLGNGEQSLQLVHNGHGKWFGNDREWKHLEGCLDIDISLSPFTNSLPLNRVQPEHLQEIKIAVVYIDILHFAITLEKQSYTRKADQLYGFSTERGDFTANIETDELNLVTRYPTLFERLLTSE